MESGQNGKWSKLKVVKMEGSDKWTQWKVVKMKSGLNEKWSK